MRLDLSKWAQSTIEIYQSEDWTDAPEILSVLAAWDGRALRFRREDAATIARGLCEMSNSEDAHAEEAKRKHPECARMARWACEGLSNAAMRVARMGA